MEIDLEANMVGEGNNPDIATSMASSMDEIQSLPNKRPETPENSSSVTPYTPSKRQYYEVDESASLREKNRTLMATNEALLQQQELLTQRVEEATQFAREAEEAGRVAREVQIQQENELKAMQLAQERFQEEMMGKFQLDLSKLMVSHIVQE